MSVTEQEFNEWRQHPVTRAIMEILDRKREIIRQNWEGGSYTDWDSSMMSLINVGNIGECKGYAYVQELDYEQYIAEIEDDVT
jgi:hypothetical protein